jgi:hypothetical protein
VVLHWHNGWHASGAMAMNEKLERAIEWMGPRYVLHPENRVQKIPLPQQQEMYRTDVAATFKRVRKSMEKSS